MNRRESLIALIKKLLTYLKYIVVVCAITGIGSIVISLLLPVYYKSTTTFLAKNVDLLTERGIFGTTTRDPQPFGNNNDNDRLITIAESNELIDYLVDSFDLYKHYKINPEGKKASFYVREKFRGLYTVVRTKRDAIELSVEDKDAELAAAIANVARERINEINLSLSSSKQLVEGVQKAIEEKESINKVMSDSIQKTRSKYGIYNTTSQSESLSDLVLNKKTKLSSSQAKLEVLSKSADAKKLRDSLLYLSASIEGLKREILDLDSAMIRFNQGMPIIQAIEEEYYQNIRQLNYYKERLKQLLTANESGISSIILVESAAPSPVKSRPSRALIVIACVFMAFLFSALGALVFDTYKDLDWREIWKSAVKKED